jgi:glycosyltransferase involved in cell wall biosynthesis
VRILLDYRPALVRRTGVGEYVHELARALAAAPEPGDDIALFSASWKDRLPANAVPGLRTIDRRVPVRALNYAWHRLGWPPIERLTGDTFDVVQSLHPIAIPAKRAARIVTVHDLDFLDHPQRTRAEIRRDYPTLAPRHVRLADGVVVISETTAADVEQRLGVPSSRITVCTPGAPPWNRRTAEPGDGCILFLGALEPRKNLGVLLDAYERLIKTSAVPPPRLVLAGKIGPDARLIQSRTVDRPLRDFVDLPGYIADSEREALYRRALLFVMPSHTEGFGMPVLEAMTVGVPVIAADRGALPEVAGGAAKFFEPDDADGLTALLAQLLTDETERRRMRELGWARAAHYSWEASARVLRRAWAQAVERRARHG